MTGQLSNPSTKVTGRHEAPDCPVQQGKGGSQQLCSRGLSLQPSHARLGTAPSSSTALADSPLLLAAGGPRSRSQPLPEALPDPRQGQPRRTRRQPGGEGGEGPLARPAGGRRRPRAAGQGFVTGPAGSRESAVYRRDSQVPRGALPLHSPGGEGDCRAPRGSPGGAARLPPSSARTHRALKGCARSLPGCAPGARARHPAGRGRRTPAAAIQTQLLSAPLNHKAPQPPPFHPPPTVASPLQPEPPPRQQPAEIALGGGARAAGSCGALGSETHAASRSTPCPRTTTPVGPRGRAGAAGPCCPRAFVLLQARRRCGQAGTRVP